MDAQTTEALYRARDALRRHLEDLEDEVDMDGGRIRDPRVLDGIRDAVGGLKCLEGMLADTPAPAKWTMADEPARGSLK